MTDKICAVCGKALNLNEVKINERRIGVGRRKSRYLCTSCRQKEYNGYTNSIKKLIEKRI